MCSDRRENLTYNELNIAPGRKFICFYGMANGAASAAAAAIVAPQKTISSLN